MSNGTRDRQMLSDGWRPLNGFTFASDMDYLRGQVVELSATVNALQCRLATLEWLEKQSCIATPELFWRRDSGETLAQKIAERDALAETRRNA